jgi:hypothetical protein
MTPSMTRLVRCAEARVLRAESRNLAPQEKARRQAWREVQYQTPNPARPHHGTYLEHHPVAPTELTIDTGVPMSAPTATLLGAAAILGSE